MKKKLLFIPLMVIGGLVATVGVVIGSLNLLKFAIYSDYYDVQEHVAKLPPVKDGYVQQGSSAFNENGKKLFVTCGYMADKVSSSRVYIVDENNNRKHIELKNPDGSNFLGHTGGITCNSNGLTYLASDNYLYEIPTEVLSFKSDVKEFKLEVKHEMEHECSAVSSIGDQIWVAEFHGHEYVCEHEYLTREGTNHAIAVKYNVSDLSNPIEVLSIRDEVQGIAQNPENNDIVLSCSYGLKDSHYYVYHSSSVETLEGESLYGLSVKALINPCKDLKAPAMSEDLEYFDGKIVTAQEAGSKKYMFGILFGDKFIHSLDI